MKMPVTPLSSPPPPPLFFSLLSLSSDFFHPFAKAGVFLCLVPLHLAHFFSASVLCGEFAPLSSTLSVLLLPPLFFFLFSAPLLFSQNRYSLHYIEKSKIFEGSLLLVPTFSASMCESLFFLLHFSVIFSPQCQDSRASQAKRCCDDDMKKNRVSSRWSNIG